MSASGGGAARSRMRSTPAWRPGVAFAYPESHEAMAGLLGGAADALGESAGEGRDGAPQALSTRRGDGRRADRSAHRHHQRPRRRPRLVDELGPQRTIYKTFLATEQCWRETRVVKPEELAWLDRVRLAPLIFQEYVPAIHDVRVTIVGPAVFAAAISPAPGGYAHRLSDGHRGCQPSSPWIFPAAITQEAEKAARQDGFAYGAIDLRRTPDDRYVFLEINPAGEWRFVEERTGQPITEAMATLLKSMDH